MKAILTHDGSIKILFPSPPLLSSPFTQRHDDKDRSKKVFLSKDSLTSSTPSSSITTQSLKSSPKCINLSKNVFLDDTDDDEDDKFSQYKMKPRQVFMANVCNVSDCFSLSVDFY
jgi:hypothetical protein